MNKLGLWVKDKRLNASLNQKEYAEKIGITDVTLSKIENSGHVSGRTLRKLSEFFNINTKILREMMLFEKEEAVNEQEL